MVTFMNACVESLFDEAMTMSPEDRADLAERLLGALEPNDPGAREEWRNEIERRVADLDSGAAKPVNLTEARARIFRLPRASNR